MRTKLFHKDDGGPERQRNLPGVTQQANCFFPLPSPQPSPRTFSPAQRAGLGCQPCGHSGGFPTRRSIHLLHVTGAASNFAAWEGGRWPRRPAVPAEPLDAMCSQELRGLCPKPGWQQPQLTHSGHRQQGRDINHGTGMEGRRLWQPLIHSYGICWAYWAGGPGLGSDETEVRGTVSQAS